MPLKKTKELTEAVVGALNIIASTQDYRLMRPRIRALSAALNSGETNLAELARAILSAKHHK